MNTTVKNTGTATRRKYIPLLIILLFVIAIILLVIARYNRVPEPVPQQVTDTAVNSTDGIPPDSLHH